VNQPPAKFSVWTGSLYFLSGLVLLFILAPLAGLIMDTPPADIVEVSHHSDVRASILVSVLAAMVATLFLSIAAIPLGYVLARKSFPLKSFVNAMIDLPIVIPHAAAGLALLAWLSKDGWFGALAEGVGLSFVGTFWGITVAMAFVSVPFLIHAARDGFSAVPERFERTAMTLGARPHQVFFTISVPMARTYIISGLIMMWARGMSEFGAIIFIAYRPMVTPVLIWEWFGTYGMSYARPLAVLFMSISLIVFVLMRWIASRNSYADR
jgi:molybdate/tungstate transport system permease protein